MSAEWEDVGSNPALANNRGLIKTATIMLAVIQDLVSVQVISSCAVKLSCWPDSFILSYQGDGELLLLFEKGKEHRPFQPGGVIYLSRGKAVYYRPAVIAVRHCRGDPAKILPYFLD